MLAIAPVFILFGVLVVGLGLGVLLWPRWGILAQRRQQRTEAERVRCEDALKHLCKTEAGGRRPTFDSVAGALHLKPDEIGALLHDLTQRGLVTFADGELSLTPTGRSQGAQVVRAHRLWECHLAENTGLHETEWHAEAEQQEHRMSSQEADALSARLGHPTHDPHGDPIPSADGEWSTATGQPLNTLMPGDVARIVHIEDEPASLYAQLADLNLRPGMIVQVQESPAERLRFRLDGIDRELTSILAHQVEVLPLPGKEGGRIAKNLADFQPGARVAVIGLARACRGPERRRLLDLGFVAGTEIEVEMRSPSGEPTAYRVRGTVIALHREQARWVLVKAAGDLNA